MNFSNQRSVAAVFVLALVLLTPANIFPCAASFPEPVFTVRGSPDEPLELFAQGRLGIVLPMYHRTYLVVAYRYLAGRPLSKAEKTAVTEAWAPQTMRFGQPSSGDVPVDDWEKARSAVLAPIGFSHRDIDPYRAVRDGWTQYLNCGNDAFLTAASTATKLAKTFGTGSPVVRDWVQAQDTVFENCTNPPGVRGKQGDTESHPHIPPPATIENAVLRLDRQYQIASANFYGGDFPTAAQQFQQIADEHDSPWRTWAPYLVARCYIREATLNPAPKAKTAGTAPNSPDGPPFNVQQMTSAEKQLQSVLKDRSLAAIHPAAQRLLNYVEGRLHPDQRLHDVAQQLEGRVPATDFTQDLIDFNWLLKRQANRSGDPNNPTWIDWRQEAAKRGLLDDLTDWVLTFQQLGSDALTHTVERWRATKSQAWLMAALNLSKGADGTTGALMQAASALPASAPAYEVAVYQRARLLAEQNQPQAARQLLDANLPQFEKGPLSAFNLLLAQRFAVAADFHQFLEYAPRSPVVYAEPDIDCDGCPETSYGQDAAKPLPKRLEGDSTVIFNQRLPLSLLTEASTGQVLPSDLRAYIATATWTRAAILGDPSVAKAVEATTVNAHSELRDYLRTYDAANSDDARSFAATWMMLHFPGMQPFIRGGAFRETKFGAIDDFRDNWWCGGQFPSKALPPNTVSYGNGPPIDLATGKQAVPVPVVQPPFPSFLTAAERTGADQQRRKLSMLTAAPDYMGRVVLDWAKAHPDDQRLPEALHLVVRATRYGCSDDKTGAISKQAFDLLHARYPNSSWAKQTPYWFK